MTLAIKIGASNLRERNDSQLVTSHVAPEYHTKETQ